MSFFLTGYSMYGGMAAGMDAAAARSKADSVDLKTGDLQRRLNYMEEWLDRMSIGMMAMSELLTERHGITEADIEAKVREIDLRDGVEDGKVTRHMNKCPKCQRDNNGRRASCLYCGTALEMGIGM